MAEFQVEGPELKKLVKLSKKQPLAFAYAPGKKPDERLVAIDRRKTASFLGKNLKKESTGNKVAFGTASLKGKLWSLTCEQIVPTMAKTLKAYLKTQNIKVNIEILDLEGNAIENDIEDLPDDPDLLEDDDGAIEDDGGTPDAQPAPGEDAAPEDTEDAELTDAERTRAIAARIKATHHDVMGTDGPVGETLKKVMAAAVSLLKSGDLDKAEETVAKLEAALAKIGAAAPKPESEPAARSSGPDAVELAGRAQALKTAIADVAEPARAKLLAALGAAAQAIKGGQLPQAAATLDKIEAALGKLAGAAPAEDTGPDMSAANARLAELRDAAVGVADDAQRAKISAALDKVAGEIGAGNADKAGQMMDTIEKAIAASAPAAAAPGADATDYKQYRQAWAKARDAMLSEITALRAEIDRVTGEIEGYEDVSSKSGTLLTYLDGIDGALEDALAALETAGDDTRDSLKANALGIVERYRSELDGAFFKAVDDNGFMQTNIRGAALASLDSVSAALAA